MVNFFIFIRSVVKQACDTFSEYSLPLQAAKLQSILPKSNLWVALFCFFFFFLILLWCFLLLCLFEFLLWILLLYGKKFFLPRTLESKSHKSWKFYLLTWEYVFFLICIWVSLVSRSLNFLIPGTKLLRNEINSSGLICN